MRYKSRKGVILCEIAGQYALVAAQHLRSEVPYVTTLNETGAFCWRLMENGIGKEELCQYILDEYDAEDAEIVKKDLEKLLEQLREHHYIEEVLDDEENI